jgi:hypothetical protein
MPTAMHRHVVSLPLTGTGALPAAATAADQQCMGRWRRHLDPSIRREGWAQEEDEQLRELFAEYGALGGGQLGVCLFAHSLHDRKHT